MKVDVWFNEQSRLVKIIFLIIPFIGWIVEALVRISAVIRKPSKLNIVGLVLFAVIGGFWVICVIDAIYFILNDKLLLFE